jgi:hypothetical protein
MDESKIRQIVEQILRSLISAGGVGRDRTNENRASLKAAQRIEEVTSSSPIPPSTADDKFQNFNYLTQGTYNGKTVKFSLAGQVLSDEQEDEIPADLLSKTFIEFAGGGKDFAFGLYVTTIIINDQPQSRVGVEYGEINGEPPESMVISGDPEFLLDPPNNGFVYAAIEFNGSGEIIERTIDSGQTIPEDTETIAHVSIGKIAKINNVHSIISQHHAGNINIRRYGMCSNGEPKYDYFLVGTKESVIV